MFPYVSIINASDAATCRPFRYGLESDKEINCTYPVDGEVAHPSVNNNNNNNNPDELGQAINLLVFKHEWMSEEHVLVTFVCR